MIHVDLRNLDPGHFIPGTGLARLELPVYPVCVSLGAVAACGEGGFAFHLPKSRRPDGVLAAWQENAVRPSYGASRLGGAQTSLAPDEPQSPPAKTPSGQMMKSTTTKNATTGAGTRSEMGSE